MTPFQPRHNKRPEAEIQDKLDIYLTSLGWLCMHTHGSAYQAGFPDMYVTHKVYSARWVEVKLPEMKGSRYTPAQLITFPRLCAHGAGVWVMTAANEKEYAKLFKAYNWSMYLL